ncbi:MAG: hypothetical protein VZQ84_01610 [Anaerovoracaceae bacterium]|nr:hypothetical protein [Anaerovoracaceae bacterium]
MTLLVTVFAAVICTAIWYNSEKARAMKVSVLCWMFWGASMMWLGDAIFEYAELHAAYFTPAAGDMLNDLFLGLSVIALAMVVWIAYVLIKDPEGTVRKNLFKNAE